MAMRRRKKATKKRTTKRKSKRLTVAQKWNQLKRQTERAGMKVSEKAGKVVVSRRKRTKKR